METSDGTRYSKVIMSSIEELDKIVKFIKEKPKRGILYVILGVLILGVIGPYIKGCMEEKGKGAARTKALEPSKQLATIDNSTKVNTLTGNYVAGDQNIYYQTQQEKVKERVSDNKQDTINGFTNHVFEDQEKEPKNLTSETVPSDLSSVNIDAVEAGIKRGKGEQLLKEGNDQLVIAQDFPAMDKVYTQLRDEIEKVFLEFKAKKDTLVKKECDSLLKELCDQAIKSSQIEKTLYELSFGEQGAQNFKIRVHGIVYIPSVRPRFGSPWIPDSSNIFALCLQRYANLSHARVQFPNRVNILTLEKNGTLTLRKERMEIIQENVTIAEVAQLIKSWMYDAEPWEAIQKDR